MFPGIDNYKYIFLPEIFETFCPSIRLKKRIFKQQIKINAQHTIHIIHRTLIDIKHVIDLFLQNGPVRSIKLQVKPHLLYKPNLNDITVMPDSSATFELFDRVVIARDGYSVPLGMHGTIISIQPSVDTNPVRQENINAVEYFYDVLFDTPFDGAQTIANLAEKRLFKVRQSVLLNISHGLGKLNQTRFFSAKKWLILSSH